MLAGVRESCTRADFLAGGAVRLSTWHRAAVPRRKPGMLKRCRGSRHRPCRPTLPGDRRRPVLLTSQKLLTGTDASGPSARQISQRTVYRIGRSAIATSRRCRSGPLIEHSRLFDLHEHQSLNIAISPSRRSTNQPSCYAKTHFVVPTARNVRGHSSLAGMIDLLWGWQFLDILSNSGAIWQLPETIASNFSFQFALALTNGAVKS